MSDAKAIPGLSAPLTQHSYALESSRDSGFDLSSSVGEIVDNSIEAKANQVRIRTVEAMDGSAIVKMAFADNGEGITLDHLPSVLSLGYSARYNSREGMGRFGMGLKLASLGQSRSVEVYTRSQGSDAIYCTTLDLDAVRDGEQTELTVREVESFPTDFADLMSDISSGEPYKVGTLVLWGDIDRLPNGGTNKKNRGTRRYYDETLDERRANLEEFLARAYRTFLSDGLVIELDGQPIDLYDPTFQRPSARVVREFGDDLRGDIIQETRLEVNGHSVHIRVTLAPLATRQKQSKGARDFTNLYLDQGDNQAISMLRQGREIYYALVPKMYPYDRVSSRSDADLDRFIGVEVSFPAVLDEFFQVRNVKRGAEPVYQLRKAIRDFISKPIQAARAQIRADWLQQVTDDNPIPSERGHELALNAVERASDQVPHGVANPETTPEQEKAALFELAEDHGIDPTDETNQPLMEELEEKFHERALTITDGRWPGKDMFEIQHLSGKAILKLNHRHPFIKDVYDVVKAEAAKDPSELLPEDVKRLLMKVDVALDVLFMAYAKAENMHKDPDTAYSALRTYWGVMTAAFVMEGVTDL